MKFLILGHFDLSRLNSDVTHAILKMPDYARKLGSKLECRYHVIGSHGGAWIYKVDSNEELDRLLAMSPVYNYATCQVIALAEIDRPRNRHRQGVARNALNSLLVRNALNSFLARNSLKSLLARNSLKSSFVIRAWLQPGRKRGRMNEGFSP